MLVREIVCQDQGKQDDVLDESLKMCQFKNLSETAAVHFGIEYEQEQGYDRKQTLHYECCQSGGLPPNAARQGGTQDRFEQCKRDSYELCSRSHEADVHEVEVFLYNQSGSDRIHKFEESGKEEYNAEKESAETFYSKEERVHVLLDYRVDYSL